MCPCGGGLVWLVWLVPWCVGVVGCVLVGRRVWGSGVGGCWCGLVCRRVVCWCARGMGWGGLVGGVSRWWRGVVLVWLCGCIAVEVGMPWCGGVLRVVCVAVCRCVGVLVAGWVGAPA